MPEIKRKFQTATRLKEVILERHAAAGTIGPGQPARQQVNGDITPLSHPACTTGQPTLLRPSVPTEYDNVTVRCGAHPESCRAGKSHVPVAVTEAAFQSRMELVDSLQLSLGREPTPAEAAQGMAEAFGDMLAYFAASGAQPHQLEAVNRMAQRAYEVMLGRVQTSS